ncbi:MAG: RNA methyltransferase [Bacteroidota bacterium]
MIEWLTSTSNQKVKNLILLEKSKERKEQNTFVVEGWRELTIAVGAGYKFHTIFVCPDLFEKKHSLGLIEQTLGKECKQFFINDKIFDKVAYRENSDGIIALGTPIYNTFESLTLTPSPLIIVLEAVEKPGNLGAVLRTADAAKVDAVIVCDPKTDLYNPNTIRSSIGCVFSNQVICCTSDDALKWLKNKKINIYSAALPSDDFYHTIDFKKSSAIVMGTESTGLTDFWLENCTKRIQIPMLGAIDSLNVSIATAILTFEAKRQRGF